MTQQPVTEWLNTYQNRNTRANYRAAVKDFLKFTRVNSEENTTRVVKEKLPSGNSEGNMPCGIKEDVAGNVHSTDQQALEYFSQERDYERDILEFLQSIQHFAPLTVKLKIGGVRLFFQEQDIEFKKKFWRKINRQIKGSRAATLDRTPTKKELRQILSHMRVKGKAFFLLLVSSGMRIGETLKLTLDDIELSEDLVKIRLPGRITKGGNSRYCYGSVETRETLEEWLKIREEYLIQSQARSFMHPKDIVGDNRVFPFTHTIAYCIWKRAIDKAELDSKDHTTGRYKLHPHSLRKFFRTKIAGLSGNADVVEALMGHGEFLTQIYRRYTERELEQFYRENQTAVLIFMEGEELAKLREDLEKSKARLETENVALKERVEKMELEVTRVKEALLLSDPILREKIREKLQDRKET